MRNLHDPGHDSLWSLQYVGEINFLHDSAVLLECNTKAIEEIIGVSLGEHGGINERSLIGFAVTMLLNGLNNVAKTVSLQGLLSDDRVEVRALLINVRKLSLINITSVHWVSHKSLIVRNWPGWSRHNSKSVVSLWNNRSKKSVLSSESSLSNYRNIALFINL